MKRRKKLDKKFSAVYIGKNVISQENEMELLSIQHELREKNTMIQILQEKFDQLKMRFLEIIGNHKSLLKQMKGLNEELDEKRKLIAELSAKLEIAELEKTRLDNMMVENGQLKNQVDALTKVKVRLERLLKSEKELITIEREEEFQRIIKILEDEKLELERKVADLEMKLLQFEKDNEVLTSKNSDNIRIISQLETRMVEMKGNQVLLDENALLQDENEKLKKRIEDLSKNLENNDDSEQIQRLEEENKNLRELLERMKKEQEENPFEEPEPEPIVEKVEIHKNENDMFEFTVGSIGLTISIVKIRLEKEKFPYSHFLPIFFSVEFFSYESYFSDLLSEDKYSGGVEVDSSYSGESLFNVRFDTEPSDLLVYYLWNKEVPFKVYVSSSGEFKEIGNL